MRVDPSARLISVRLAGAVSAGDLRAARQEIRDDPRYVPDFRLLVDASGAQFAFRLAELEAFVTESREDPREFQGDCAIVVTGAVPAAFAHLYQARHRTRRLVEVFSDLATARAWLGLPEV